MSAQDARADQPVCDAAARRAAEESGVPLNLLLAITRVETGRDADRTPWPWTVNQGGDGAWLDTKAEAMSAVDQALANGATNIDIGCFQLNHRWHAAGFATVGDMFDPVANARYAAKFLMRLHRETGNWSTAAATYHSRSPGPADRYLAKIETVMATLSDQPQPEPAVLRPNSYLLLQAGAAGRHGSLVPLQGTRGPLIGANP